MLGPELGGHGWAITLDAGTLYLLIRRRLAATRRSRRQPRRPRGFASTRSSAAKPTRICRHTISIRGAAATRALEGQRVRVYNVAKTIADLFKYRKKIGLEVALEALREVWRGRRVTIDEIDHYARICRVERVMRPYLEALTA